MNSAPAELLHPLTYAALQLSWRRPSGSARAMAQEDATTGAGATPKKTPACSNASVGIAFLKNLGVFQRKSRLTRQDGVKRR
ncbi:hypothetical protein ABTD49_20950, partial [Acinetobacter baumannii]